MIDLVFGVVGGLLIVCVYLGIGAMIVNFTILNSIPVSAKDLRNQSMSGDDGTAELTTCIAWPLVLVVLTIGCAYVLIKERLLLREPKRKCAIARKKEKKRLKAEKKEDRAEAKARKRACLCTECAFHVMAELENAPGMYTSMLVADEEGTIHGCQFKKSEVDDHDILRRCHDRDKWCNDWADAEE